MKPGNLALLAALLFTAAPALAQTPAAPAATPPAPPLEVGVMAPDFELVGATRFGILKDPVKLSDYRGKTVVIAFFARARTKG